MTGSEGKVLLTAGCRYGNARRRHPHLVPRFLEHVQSSRALVCLHPEQTHFEKAAAFLRKHLDQRYSFVDCSSMVIAKELGLDRVLTTDHHFQACGFETPLLS